MRVIFQIRVGLRFTLLGSWGGDPIDLGQGDNGLCVGMGGLILCMVSGDGQRVEPSMAGNGGIWFVKGRQSGGFPCGT